MKKDRKIKGKEKNKKKNKLSGNKMVLFSVLGLFLFIGIVLGYYSFIVPKVVVNGSKVVTLEVFDNYKDQGAYLERFGKIVKGNISTNGEVNNNKLGTYVLTYKYKNLVFTKTNKREIKVIDSVFPEIELTGNLEVKLCPNALYQEEGYSAKDNYDGDITNKVERIESIDTITYKVVDSYGNVTTKERVLVKEDYDKPTITLTGGTSVGVKLNSTYTEQGYSANDNCDGDLTNSVVVSGSVDTSKTGTYVITYKVSDNSGNETVITRNVMVYNSVGPQYGGKVGVIYLTFDDGPTGSGSTAKILNVLKEKGVKATFFVTSNGPDNLVKRMHDEGHTVALHTATHDYSKVYGSLNGYLNDLSLVSNRVKRVTGVESKIVRFPGGSSNTVSISHGNLCVSTIINDLHSKGYKIFDWNIDSNDAGSCAKAGVTDRKTCVYNNVVKGFSKSRSNVVLMHDIKSYTADALASIIDYGLMNGYTFEAITMETTEVIQKTKC